MAAEHSPAPWTYKPSESDNGLFQVLDASGRVVAFVRRGNGGRAEAMEFEANARLIASAASAAAQPPEFQEATWGVDSVMRPCKSMAVSEFSFREWCKANGIALAAGVMEVDRG